MPYTITITEEQKQLVALALSKFSEYTLGQTTVQQEAAKKLEQQVHRFSKHATNDLTK